MTATIEPTATLTVGDLRGDRRRLAKERIVRGLLGLAATLSIVISVLIIWSLVREAWNFISDVDLGALTDTGWFPRRGRFDVGTILIGTFVVSGIGMLVATPLGLGAAVYLSEYANPRARRILKPIVEILAGIPSVVIGFFAVSFIGPDIVQPLWNTTQPKNMLVTGIAIGILVIPLVAAISEDALRAVPMALREASFGVGARKSTTVVRIVLPAAISGIVAAFIVATSRAIGETMVAALASGRDGSGPFAWHPTDPGLTMTAAMAGVASGTDQVAGSGLAFQSLFFVGIVLFVMTLVLNIIADRFVARVRQKY